jgi:hypothetical protein
MEMEKTKAPAPPTIGFVLLARIVAGGESKPLTLDDVRARWQALFN